MQPEKASEPFALPELPFAVDALEPYIDARTIEIHHGKHHAAYVSGLNQAVSKYPHLTKLALEELIRDAGSLPVEIRTPIRNHGGGHVNHSLYWQVLSKHPRKAPAGELAAAIDQRFGKFDALQAELTRAALGQFGSGWAWLTTNPKKELFVESTSNQETPIAAGRIPLMVIDVWEHAYYLQYQNRRADYVKAIFNILNWEYASAKYATAGSSRQALQLTL